MLEDGRLEAAARFLSTLPSSVRMEIGRKRKRLSEQDVKEIRERYANGDVFQRELALEFGVNQTVISRVVRHVY